MENTVNAAFFEKRYPSIYSEIFEGSRKQGRQAGFIEGHGKGFDEGVAAWKVQEKVFEEDFKNYTGQSDRLLSFEEQTIFDWKADEKLRREFVSFSSFKAFRQAVRAGKVRA